jgi:hypothetical protein
MFQIQIFKRCDPQISKIRWITEFLTFTEINFPSRLTFIARKVKAGFGYWILGFEIYPSTWLRVVSPSTLLRTVRLSIGLSNHLKFGACYLYFALVVGLCESAWVCG